MAVALPVAGIGIGIGQTVRGAINTPEAVRENYAGRKWDKKKRVRERKGLRGSSRLHICVYVSIISYSVYWYTTHTLSHCPLSHEIILVHCPLCTGQCVLSIIISLYIYHCLFFYSTGMEGELVQS